MKERLDPRINHVNQGGGDIDTSCREHNAVLVSTQEEGLNALNRFLLRETNFDSLKTFSLDLTGEKYKRQGGHFQFYLGRNKESNNNPYFLCVSPNYYLGYEPKQLFVVPRVARIGKKPYYWIELIEESTENVTHSSFLSCRLRPDKPITKIDSIHWKGLEEQLLVDFILGENGIKFDDLLPITLELNSKVTPYRLGGVKDLALRFAENPNVSKDDRLVLLPKIDPQDSYSWIEIYKKDESKNMVKVSVYRILHDKRRLVTLGWKDPDVQRYLDYLSGNTNVVFDDLSPVKVQLPERFNQVPFGQGTEKYFSINIGNSTELGFDKVILIPRQDPKGLYQWVDAYKFNPQTGEPIGEIVTSARMIQGVGFKKTGWFGAGRQSLIDYSNDEKSFEGLLPIVLQVGANTSILDVWGVQKEHVWLTLSVKSGLKSGDNIELIPAKETDGVVIYKMVHGQVELGSYIFDRQTKKFSVLDLHDVRNIVPQPRDYLVGYSHGKVGFAELKPIQLNVKKNPGMIDILSRGDVHIYITPAKSFGLVPEDEVELIPEEESEGQVIFAFIKDGKVLGRYRYNSQAMKFYLQKNNVEDMAISSEEANRWIDSLFEKGEKNE